MKPDAMIRLVIDAVTDAIRDTLPGMVANALDERLALTVKDKLIEMDRDIARLAAFAPDRDALAKLAADVEAVRAEIEPKARAISGELADRLAGLESGIQKLATIALDRDVLAGLRTDVEGLRAEIEAKTARAASDAAQRIAAAVAGLEPIPGPAGPPGPAGAPGAPGINGRDASFVVPVHYSAGLAVERGAIVQHRGGLWYANAATNAEPGTPVSGYSLILDGCEPERSEVADDGTPAIVFRYASGLEKRMSLGYRPPSYAGVFDQTRAYLPNDLVTYQGSMWIARRDTEGARPGTDAGALVWTLVVKSGKDGRDGERGPPGARGEQGPPGAPAPSPAKKPRGGNGAHAT